MKRQFANRAITKTLPTFALEVETNTIIAAMGGAGATPNVRRQISLNRLVVRLKAAGVWTRLSALYVIAADTQAQGQINLVNPGTNNLVQQGTPTFTQWKGCSFPTINDYFDTLIAASTPAQNDVSMGVFARNGLSNNSYNMGAADATATTGYGIEMATAGPYQVVFAGCNTTLGNAYNSSIINDTEGMQALNRYASGYYDIWHNSASFPISLPSTSTTLSTTIAVGKVNGRTTTCAQTLGAAFVGRSMTTVQMQTIYSAVRDYLDKVEWGDININYSGFQPAAVTATHVVYGTTPMGLCHAIQLMRDGENVIVVGGWRDRQIGGMSANGLGEADYNSLPNLSGLPRSLLTLMNNAMGQTDNQQHFAPRYFTAIMRQKLDVARTSGFNVPIYFSDGVVAVNKTGTRITSFSTADGRTFTGTYFHDASYEGDLLALAGVSWTMGREAAGSGFEGYGGNRGSQTGAGALYYTVNVDPYNTPGNAASGPLPGIEIDTETVGQADNRVQASCFRLSMTSQSSKAIALSNVPPFKYAKANYELWGRWAQAFVPQLSDCLKLQTTLPTNMNDVNNNGPVSTDLIGILPTQYVTATYAQREVIWQQHIQYTLGYLYFMGYEADTRVPSGLRTSMHGLGFEPYHYLDPYLNDPLHFPPQIYVREARRMVSDFILNGNDVGANDGTTPRSIKTIALASYNIDSHEQRRIINTSGYAWNEGGLQVASGGSNLASPIPYEAALPPVAQVTNLSVSFCVSSTHVAFSATRMEYTGMLIGQATAVAARIARQNGGQNLQTVDYPTLRTALLAVSDAVQPLLPQVN